MSLVFKIIDGLGVFLPENEELYAKLQETVKELVDAGNMEKIRTSKVIKGLKRLLSKTPFFIPGWALLGGILEDMEDNEAEVWEVYTEGYRAALKIIPKDFVGPLNTENFEVQCFLRCHSKYVEFLISRQEYPAALVACRRQLIFDPEDMFDQALELGELARLAEETSEAEEILLNQVEVRPTAYYSLGHMAFCRGDFALAVNYLRRAFILAPYAVAILTGRPMLPNLFWEYGPEAPELEDDISYIEMLGSVLWGTEERVHSFLYWLSQTSVVLKEHAACVALSEKCFAAYISDSSDSFDHENNAEIMAEFAAIMAGIDDQSSAALVVLTKDPEDGTELRPWELLVLNHKRIAEDNDFGDYDEDCDCEVCRERKVISE